MKKLIDLKCGDPIYILKISRDGVIYNFEETKCLKITKDEEIDIWYFDGEYDDDLFFSLYEDDMNATEMQESRNCFYSDIEAVSEKLNEYKIQLKIKQDLLNKVYEKSNIGSK